MISKTKVIGFLKMSKDEKKMSICRNTYRLLHKKSFFSIGKRSYIYKPIHLAGSKYISMGNDVGIWNNARIEIIDKWHDQRFSPRLAIGNNVNIGQDLHLTVAESVEIQDGVVCSGRVTITDINHVTDDPDSPVLEQGIATKPVKICEGAFIGVHGVRHKCEVTVWFLTYAGFHLISIIIAILTRDYALSRIAAALNTCGIWVMAIWIAGIVSQA